MMGRVLYAAAFCVALPALLVAWCRWAEPVFGRFEMPGDLWAGWAGWLLAALGGGLIGAGWWALWFRGGGLPMNAFPPVRRVESGVFAWIDHPIYVGAVLLTAGASLVTGSRAGLWGATPLLALGCAALVWGFEGERTARLLGRRVGEARLRLPAAEDVRALGWDRVSAYVLMFLPWGVLYEAMGHVPLSGSVGVHFGFEHAWPAWAWTVPVYTSCYVLALLTPMVCRTRMELRRLMVLGWCGTALGVWCYAALPLTAAPREGGGTGAGAEFFWSWLMLERADGLAGRAAVPSFHVFWALGGAWVLGWRWPRLAWLWWVWAGLIGASCVTTGMHALVDIPAGALLFVIAARFGVVWNAVRGWSERAANTWREWRFGPVRVLLHAPIAALAAGCGAWVIGVMDEGMPRAALWVVALAGLIGAGAWGQWLEYSGKLARPFGYYGHVLGAGLGLAGCWWMDWGGWGFAAALATAAPLAQAIGRVRCLVNGCCHGRLCGARMGIVCVEPRSRVIRLAGLGGVPIHATQTYSALANIALFAVLLRLWWCGAPAAAVIGVYLVGSGLARFVEEHYRGEPQTPTLGGLHSYQWMALGTVLAGAAVLAVPSTVPPWPSGVDLSAWVDAGLIGLVYGVAMGVDFPGSARRFARLA